MIVGREREQQLLKEAFSANGSEFVAVYGRRRVGKTYLVGETFGKKFTFVHAGLANANRKSQLQAWADSLKDYGAPAVPIVDNWLQAFGLLKDVILASRSKKRWYSLTRCRG